MICTYPAIDNPIPTGAQQIKEVTKPAIARALFFGEIGADDILSPKLRFCRKSMCSITLWTLNNLTISENLLIYFVFVIVTSLSTTSNLSVKMRVFQILYYLEFFRLLLRQIFKNITKFTVFFKLRDALPETGSCFQSKLLKTEKKKRFFNVYLSIMSSAYRYLRSQLLL